MDKGDKTGRVLDIYTRLISGYVVNKAELAMEFNVNERSITRDIDDIRAYLSDQAVAGSYFGDVIYDRAEKGYRLDRLYHMRLTNSEILAICKILLDSRAFTKRQMKEIIGKLIENGVPKSHQKAVTELVKNEEYHYVELSHKNEFLDKLWKIGDAILKKNYLEIGYYRLDKNETVKRRIKPAAIMFNEFYFYLAAFIEDKELEEKFDLEHSLPTIYRIDRIKTLKVTEDSFAKSKMSRFEEGEFRKRMQFMYGGKLQRLQFDYVGNDIVAVLDRLPTAKIIDKKDGIYKISAEVYGDGVKIWLKGWEEDIKNVVFR